MTPALLALGWCLVVWWAASRALSEVWARGAVVWARVRRSASMPGWGSGATRRLLEMPGVNSFVRVGRGVAERRRVRRRDAELERSLPLVVDLVAVGIGAGTSLLQAVELAQRWAPPIARSDLQAILQRVRYGALLPDALTAQSQRSPVLRSVTETLATAVRLGSPLQPTLARIAAEYRTSLARSSATRARTVPVRLIFPLVFLVLPSFALITVVPALVAGWHTI